ncbi:MAG: hypothetical protein CSA76_03115 [Spirochaetales bacterium]|nr:MAG: hypothetical protein CSA76_03115 [Spirochaetales bacterium]
MKKRRLLLVLLVLLGVFLISGCTKEKSEQQESKAWAPSSEITIINPWSVGGSADTKTRLVAQYLEDITGQNVVVKVINGGAGALAAADFLGKPYDPHRMMLPGIGMFTLVPLMNKNLPYTFDDFRVVAELVSEPFILFTNPSKSGISSMEELLEFAKNNHLVYASNPPGGTTYLLQTALFKMAGVEAESVAGSSVENLTALLGGHVHVTAVNPSLGKPYLKDGTLVPIGVFSDGAYTAYEDFTVPSVKNDFGYDIVFQSSNFFVLGKEASDETVDYYYKAFMEVYENPEFLKKAAEMNYTPSKMPPDELKNKILSTADLFKRLTELIL